MYVERHHCEALGRPVMTTGISQQDRSRITGAVLSCIPLWYCPILFSQLSERAGRQSGSIATAPIVLLHIRVMRPNVRYEYAGSRRQP